jgi:hypothetical protein
MISKAKLFDSFLPYGTRDKLLGLRLARHHARMARCFEAKAAAYPPRAPERRKYAVLAELFWLRHQEAQSLLLTSVLTKPRVRNLSALFAAGFARKFGNRGGSSARRS